MGILSLYSFIKKFVPDSISEIKIYQCYGLTLAIDANFLIHKSVSAIRTHIGKEIVLNEKNITHIYAILLKLLGFKKYKINAIFIFDSEPLILKQQTLKKRKKNIDIIRKKYKSFDEYRKKIYYHTITQISKKQYNEIKKLISYFGFTIINAPNEADKYCAYLSKHDIVDAIVTDDLDVLAFGGKNVIKNFSIDHRKQMQIINLQTILNSLNININEFVKLCIALGTDYNEKIKGIKKKNIINFVKKNKFEQYSEIKKYFLYDDKEKPKIKKNKIDKKKLFNFLEKYSLDKNKLIINFFNNN